MDLPNREIALEFIERFCAGDVDGLTPLLAEDLQFKGPLFRFDSRAAYLDSLRGDLEKTGYQILSVTENEDSVSVYYDYDKPGGAMTIAQLFKFRDRIISELTLVFDPSPLHVEDPSNPAD